MSILSCYKPASAVLILIVHCAEYICLMPEANISKAKQVNTLLQEHHKHYLLYHVQWWILSGTPLRVENGMPQALVSLPFCSWTHFVLHNWKESLVLFEVLLIYSGSSTRQLCFSSARWMTPRVPIINTNLLFVQFQADVAIVLQILLDTFRNTPPATTSTMRWNTSYGAAMSISVSPIVRPSSHNDCST